MYKSDIGLIARVVEKRLKYRIFPVVWHSCRVKLTQSRVWLSIGISNSPTVCQSCKQLAGPILTFVSWMMKDLFSVILALKCRPAFLWISKICMHFNSLVGKLKYLFSRDLIWYVDSIRRHALISRLSFIWFDRLKPFQ